MEEIASEESNLDTMGKSVMSGEYKRMALSCHIRDHQGKIPYYTQTYYKVKLLNQIIQQIVYIKCFTSICSGHVY